MTKEKTVTSTEGRDLILTRIIDAPPEKVFQAWTTPDLMKQWFAPSPWTTIFAETDVRAGGSSMIVMRGPDGTEIPCPGVYLEVVPNKRIVATDAFTKAWELSDKPFMVLDLSFERHEGKTKYTARARHWNTADREAHEKMGFHEGWKLCTEQLAALVEKS
ncbi:MAG: SRPBCC family protein [Burkholderiaceae bacterium]